MCHNQQCEMEHWDGSGEDKALARPCIEVQSRRVHEAESGNIHIVVAPMQDTQSITWGTHWHKEVHWTLLVTMTEEDLKTKR